MTDFTSLLLLVASLPLLALGAVWIFRHPFPAFGLYAAIIPIGSAFRIPIGLPRPFDTPSTILGAMVSAALLVKLIRDDSVRAPIRPAVWVWGLFLGLNVLTIAWSIDTSETGSQVVVLASLIAQYAVVASFKPTLEQVLSLERKIEFGGFISGSYAVVLLATGNLPMSGIGIPRFQTTGGDPNITAASLLLPLAIALGRFIGRRDRRGEISGLFSAAIIMVAILLTVSRGGLVGAVIVIIAWAVIRRSPRSYLVPAVLVVMIALVAPLGIAERFTNTSSTGRTDVWRVAASACSEFCAIGSGTGTFPLVHETELLSNPTLTSIQLRLESHNLWIGTLIETGVLGLLLVSIGLALTAQQAWRAGPRHRSGIVALSAILVSNLFLANVEFKYFWLVVAYAALTRTVSQDAVESQPALPAAKTRVTPL